MSAKHGVDPAENGPSKISEVACIPIPARGEYTEQVYMVDVICPGVLQVVNLASQIGQYFVGICPLAFTCAKIR